MKDKRQKDWLLFDILLPLILTILFIGILLLAGIGFAYIISNNTDISFLAGMIIWLIISIVFILLTLFYTRRA